MNIFCKLFRSYISCRLERKNRIRKQMIDECRESLDNVRLDLTNRLRDSSLSDHNKTLCNYFIETAIGKEAYQTRKRIQTKHLYL